MVASLRTVLRRKWNPPPMPEYVAELCHTPGNELVPFDTKEFSADNHDEAVKQAIEWLSLTDIAIDDSTWLHGLHPVPKTPS